MWKLGANQKLKSGIFCVLESGICNGRIRNPAPGIRNPQRGIQNLILSWITLHGANTKTNFFGEVLLCWDFSFPFIMLLLKGKCRIVSRTVTLHIHLSLVDRSCLYSFVCLFRFVLFKHYFQARGRLKKQNLEKKSYSQKLYFISFIVLYSFS